MIKNINFCKKAICVLSCYLLFNGFGMQDLNGLYSTKAIEIKINQIFFNYKKDLMREIKIIGGFKTEMVNKEVLKCITESLKNFYINNFFSCEEIKKKVTNHDIDLFFDDIDKITNMICQYAMEEDFFLAPIFFPINNTFEKLPDDFIVITLTLKSPFSSFYSINDADQSSSSSCDLQKSRDECE